MKQSHDLNLNIAKLTFSSASKQKKNWCPKLNHRSTLGNSSFTSLLPNVPVGEILISSNNLCVKSVQVAIFFWPVFSCIWTEYGDLLHKSHYSVKLQENTNKTKIPIWRLFMRWMFTWIYISIYGTGLLTITYISSVYSSCIISQCKRSLLR